MSRIYTYSNLSSRVKRQSDDELNLFKMATVCGFPGASTRWLPFTHSRFPASPTIPPPKCYTFSPRREQTSMSVTKRRADDSCQAVVCYQERDLVQLPEIPNHLYDRRSSNSENGYVNKNKVCFKLKGINPKQVYSLNRSKLNVSKSHRHSLECLRINPHTSAMDPLNQALESIAKATLQATSSEQARILEPQRDSRIVSPINITMKMKFDDERRYNSSGLKGKKIKDGRPLGHVISPRRLNSILQDKERTQPYTYYKPDMTHKS